ncbi:transglycosylase SLT domain-containing protein [Vibrio jasicida]|uniref:Lytic murein transglycosylase n=1 Tax=Vibrio jasicida TaxID=766224 RepID=A0AAU9QN35_9VIBR|nr:transglycosylase SLT domain-containing protein [Vibrio jasicida]CAH1595355.1 Lytic murein transglycosylase [Vibrio jasicida]CAH1600426.1 Lytic murein transglycosylase [Vibrio jasicida]
MSFYSPLFENYLLIVLSIVLLYASYPIQAKMTAVDKNSVAQQNRQSLNNKKLRLKPAPTASTSSRNHVIELRGKNTPSSQTVYSFIKKPTSPAALQYLPTIVAASKQWQIDPALILAVIHTESAFNPNAVSHADAIGLMQVMVNGGALEVSQQLYFGRRIEREALFEPEFNIDIGTAYLHILETEYLHAIHSEKSRTLLAIAAYNCGLSNLMRYLSYTQSIPNFTKEMNNLNDEEVYFRLTQTLPIEETRLYVAKVMKLYQHYKKHLTNTP